MSVFASEGLSEHFHACLSVVAIVLGEQSWIVVTEIIWLTNLEIFIIWPIVENIYNLLPTY